MVGKVIKLDTDWAVLLPQELLDHLQLNVGDELHIELSTDGYQLVLTPVEQMAVGIDKEFARQVAAFIDAYRPALEALT